MRCGAGRGTRVRVGYRHITLALFAQAFLAVVRARVAGVEKGGLPHAWQRT